MDFESPFQENRSIYTGGAGGIDVPNDKSMYILCEISNYPCEPIVIQRQSPAPVEDEVQ